MKKTGTLDKIIKTSTDEKIYYGCSEYIETENTKMKYYICGKTKINNFEKITIPKATWVIFNINSKEQADILKIIDTVYTTWNTSSKYNIILPYPTFEIYYKNSCELCIPVSD